MTEHEHLAKIVAKCRAKVFVACDESEKAAYRSTITAIAALDDMDADSADILAKNIRAEWPEEQL